jgi:branched-chain amino acid transport system ATP-binding protein
MNLLEVDGLVVRYGAYTAVAGVSFSVAQGEIVAIIGPNGAGKTTCFNAINGQRRPDAGRVRLEGRDIVGSTPERLFRRGVARTFQVTATVPSMTVRENVQMALAVHRRRAWALWPPLRQLYRAEADGLLSAVGMEAHAEEPCGVLAYGDLKRLELAIALANEPRILLMDEPTAGMAPGERSALMALAASLARERGVGILFTEHDMDIVFGHAGRVVVLNRGQCVASGAPEAIRADARVQEIYLGGGAHA